MLALPAASGIIQGSGRAVITTVLMSFLCFLAASFEHLTCSGWGLIVSFHYFYCDFKQAVSFFTLYLIQFTFSDGACSGRGLIVIFHFFFIFNPAVYIFTLHFFLSTFSDRCNYNTSINVNLANFYCIFFLEVVDKSQKSEANRCSFTWVMIA